MSNNDIFRKELEELETSLIFPDASWNWYYNDDYGWYDITLHLTESKTFWRTEIDLSILDNLPNLKGAARFAITNLYNIARGRSVMNKKLTREEAIRLHREMWKDMQANLGDNPDRFERAAFKKKWVEDHFPNEHVNSNCFLCEYAESVAEASFIRCRHCPIAWNSDIHPDCNPGPFDAWEGKQVDYRYSPISVILALPEREVTE